MTYIVYQAYGSDIIAGEALFSIFSLINFGVPEELRVNIYTDRKEFFQKYLMEYPWIEYSEITDADLKAWRGKIDFVHRVKIEILKNHLLKHPKENLLYLDGDTWFINSPISILNNISNGTFYMHVKEGEIDKRFNLVIKKLYKFLKKAEKNDLSTFKIPTSTTMWNAGVIGLPHGFSAILDHALAITDEMYALYPKHIVEQLAFSYLLSSNSQIQPADDVVYHYWNFKEYRNHIADFLKANKDLSSKDLIVKSKEIAPQTLEATLLKEKKKKKGIFRLFK